METTDNLEQAIQSIKTQLVCDGKIDKDGVVKLRDFLQKDGVYDMNRDKADMLFELKNLSSTAPEKRDDSFKDIFVEAICNYLVSPLSKSPGEIDGSDEDWLEGKLKAGESKYDSYDEDLLASLKQQSLNFPKSLEQRLARTMMKRILRKLKQDKENGNADITDELVKEIRQSILGDNYELRIDDKKEAADYMFRIKDLVFREDTKEERRAKRLQWKRKPNYSESFSNLFVEVVSSYVLEDENSLGSIDETEAKWLIARIKLKGGLDDYDVDLLAQLRNRSVNYPEMLVNKEQWVKNGESLIFKSRIVSISAVIASLIASFLLFIKGIVHIGNALFLIFQGNITSSNCTTQNADTVKNIADPGEWAIRNLIKGFAGKDVATTPFVQIIESVDTFLVALVLLIFAIGIYELFIGKFDPIIRINDKRPSWMRVTSIDDLKSSLVKVLLIAMIVGFYKQTLIVTDYQNLMFLAIGILLISAAFCVAEISAHYHKKNSKE